MIPDPALVHCFAHEFRRPPRHAEQALVLVLCAREVAEMARGARPEHDRGDAVREMDS